MLEVRNVTVFIGKARVVTCASLAIPRGATVALVGPNGAGKTTLLRAISGLLKVAEGEIRAHIDGRDVALTALTPHEIVRFGISHVPEGRGLFTELSTQENLMAGSLFPRARRQRDAQLEFVFGLFKRLQERRWQTSALLSGGEQQMLALGRALMACPELLILDEPSIGLAPAVVAELYSGLAALKKAGMTLLVVEQDIPHVARICDLAYVMSAGTVVRRFERGELSADAVRQHYLGARLAANAAI